MLPQRNSKEFPTALKLAREKKGLTNTQLAEAIDINTVMIGRYEHSCAPKYFSVPSLDTWNKLNNYLFDGVDSKIEYIKDISEFSTDELINELKNRGAQKINIEW